MDAQIVLRDHYDVDYLILNHAHPDATNPFGLVLQSWAEDITTNGSMYDRMKKFADCEIPKLFGLTFTEFIQQPTWMCEMQIQIAAEKQEKHTRLANEVLTGLKPGDKP